MKYRWLNTSACLCAILGIQIHADIIAEYPSTVTVGAESNLQIFDLPFPNLSASLTASDSYWSNSASWTFDSNDTNGYTVKVTSNAGAGTTHWSMSSGTDTIDFVLVTDRTITDAAASSITASAGTNNNTIGNLGGRIVTPNTTPNPDENILFDTSTEDATGKTYVMYAAIAGSALTSPTNGSYSKQLDVELVEGTP